MRAVLEQSSSGVFEESSVRYEGTDASSVLSGLAEGTHYFRIGSKEGDSVSKPLAVRVEFFPRDKLVLLLVFGAVVVLATIGAIIMGSITTRKKEGDS